MDPAAIFYSFARARDRLPARLSFARVKSPPVLAFSSQVAPPVLSAPQRSSQVPPRRLVSDSLQVLAMESLATTIGYEWRRVEGRGVLVAIDGPFMARRKSRSRGGPGDVRDRPFAKPCAAWHICQVCSLICQVAQNANFKCKNIGYLFCDFWQIIRTSKYARALQRDYNLLYYR